VRKKFEGPCLDKNLQVSIINWGSIAIQEQFIRGENFITCLLNNLNK
jgi:hypothetical protein